MKTVKFTNGSFISGESIIKSDFVIRDGRMDLNFTGPCDETIDISGSYVCPGFTDIHFHGFKLFDFTMGLMDAASGKFDSSPAAFSQGFDMLSKELARFGVTSYYLATIAADIQTLTHCTSQLHSHMSKNNSSGAIAAGAFIEGTFINPAMCGAQNPSFVHKPSIETFKQIAASSQDAIKLVNITCDCDGSLDLIRYLDKHGIIVGTGHTAATGNQIRAAVKAGLKYFVHFLNGPTSHNYKPFDGGAAVETVLDDDSIYAEQILDGFHINPRYVRDVIKRKGPEKVIGVTDALYVAGSSISQFDLGGILGQVSPDRTYVSVKDKPNTLCSSVLTMDRAFQNLLNWLTVPMPGIWNRVHDALSLPDALAAASKICSTNPNKLLNNPARADLCVFDLTGAPGSYSLSVNKAIVSGNIVYSR